MSLNEPGVWFEEINTGPPFCEDRDPDLEKSELVQLKFSKKRFRTSGRQIDDDPVLRAAVLKTRSVVAMAFRLGDIDATLVDYTNGNATDRWMIIGQPTTLRMACTDLLDMIARSESEVAEKTRLLVPISRFDSGWRTQFGWVALRNPVAADGLGMYDWLRPSFKWLDAIKEDGIDHVAALVSARNFRDQLPLRSMEAIIKSALLCGDPEEYKN